MASIQGIYIALFGRPADPTGLAYFNTVTNNGADLTAIGDLASTAEYQNRFAGKSNSEIITIIYQTLFGRDPEQAGLNFFLQALADGTCTMQNIAIAILDGAQGDDLISVNNKIAAADEWVIQLDTDREQNAYVGTSGEEAGRIFISRTNTNSDTVPNPQETQAAIDELLFGNQGQDTSGGTGNGDGADEGTGGTDDNGSTGGSGGGGGTVPAFTFLLTTNQDNAVGGPGSDTINGVATGTFATSTLQFNDTINGAAGVDIINITETGAVDLGAGNMPVLNNVEIVNITANGLKPMGLENRILVDATLMPHATQINMVNGISDIELTNVTLNGLSFAMSGNAGDSDFEIKLVGGDTGANDSVDIFLRGNPDSDDIEIHGSTTAAAMGGVETWNIWSQDAPNMISDIRSLDSLQQDVLKNLFVRGEQNFSAADFDGSITFVADGLYDGSTAIGQQDVSFRTTAGAITVRSGNADDRIIFDAIEATDIIDGAGGTNTIGIFGNAAVVAGGLTGVSNAANFEIAGLSTVQQDVDDIGLFNTYIISSFGLNAGYLDLANNANVLISDDTRGVTLLDLKTDTGADVLNIRLDNGSNSTQFINQLAVGADGPGIVETVNIQLGAAGGTITVDTNSILAQTINITGDENLNFCNLQDSVVLMDASTATGDVTVTTFFASADASTILTGGGEDEIVLNGADGGDVVANSGNGSDSIIVAGAQEHTVTLGGGGDFVGFFDVAAAGNGDINSLTQELTITDFMTGVDVLDLIVGIFNGLGNGALVDGTNYFEDTLDSTARTVSDIEALANGAGIADDQNYVAAIEIGTNVHLFFDANGKNNAGAMSEFAILRDVDLTGINANDLNSFVVI